MKKEMKVVDERPKVSKEEMNAYLLQELTLTGEATYQFIRDSELDMKTKLAFRRLEKQFELYKMLME